MTDEKPIRDYVLPLIEASRYRDEYRFEKFHGTCFLVGSEGYALTNHHLTGVDKGNILCALTVSDTTWSVHEVLEKESHPTEDVALLKLKDIDRESFLRISSKPEHSSLNYMQWSYPDDVTMELVANEKLLYRPDLIFLEGYIRRRMSDIPVPGIKGSACYELSEPGNLGCSGSPVIDRRGGAYWQVIGIFIGNKRTTVDNGYSAVGYAVRSDAIYSWQPEIISRNISNLM